MILANGMNQPIAPQAFAETAPLFFDGYFVGSQGIQLETRFSTYAQIYLTQPWVAALVDKIASSIARLGTSVWDTSSPSGKRLMRDSPYAKLMANPGATLDPYSFWQWLSSTFEVYGEAFLLKVKDADTFQRDTVIDGKRAQVSSNPGKTVGFIPMQPSLTQTFRDQYGDVAYWFMGQPNELMSQDMVVPFFRYNPNMTQRGVSRLEPLRSTIMAEDSSRRAVQAWWKNNGRPSGMILVDGKLDPLGRKRLREQWNQMYQGSENVGSTAVLENGSKFQVVQQTAGDLQYIDSRKLNREEACAVFDVPPPVVHILDSATYSNITEQMRSMYRDTMAPRLEFLESVINFYVGKEFGETEEMRFDVAEVMRGDFEARADGWTKLVQSGIAKISEARPYFDLGDAGPVADELYAQQQMVPLASPLRGLSHEDLPATGIGGPANGKTPPPGRVHASERARKYVRDIGGRIGRGESLESAARAVLKSNPGDEPEIADACMSIMERQRA